MVRTLKEFLTATAVFCTLLLFLMALTWSMFEVLKRREASSRYWCPVEKEGGYKPGETIPYQECPISWHVKRWWDGGSD